MHKTPEQERISALVDSWLSGPELVTTLETVIERSEQWADWHVYHVIGDVLRSPELAHCSDDTEFVGRLRQRLQLEPPLTSRVVVVRDVATVQVPRSLVAANDEPWRWSI